jgi:hypothetical protein
MSGVASPEAPALLSQIKRERSPANLGGLCAIAAAFLPLIHPAMIVLSAALLMAAFVLAIVSIARGKVGGGIALMVGLMLAFAMSIATLTDRDKILRSGYSGSTQSLK